MKVFVLSLCVALSSAVAASAQTDASYRVDNFDFANGVRIETPPQPSVKRNTRLGKVKLTSESFPKLSASPLPKLTGGVISQSLEGFTTGDSTIDGLIVDSGNRNGVDPVLLYAIMHQESTFKRRAISPKGARGLMQLMPGTAARYGVTNIFDPRQNIEGGARYMRFLLDTFDGDVSLALAGYNAGEGAVMKYGYRVPPYSETQEYVRRIGQRYALMRDPMAAQTASRLSAKQLAAMRAKEAVPLNMYERSVYAVRTSDGRLQLLSQ
jgi:soluble lytic murein transglycosylase-like protein